MVCPSLHCHLKKYRHLSTVLNNVQKYIRNRKQKSSSTLFKISILYRFNKEKIKTEQETLF